MIDNETKKALEEYIKENEFEYFHSNTMSEYELIKGALKIINHLQEENEQLEYKLLGIMHFVDKWLDDTELKQDEVNRASAMREKTLQIVEKQQAEIERLNNIKFGVDLSIGSIKTEAIKEFAERLKVNITINNTNDGYLDYAVDYNCLMEDIDDLKKEMVGEDL